MKHRILISVVAVFTAVVVLVFPIGAADYYPGFSLKGIAYYSRGGLSGQTVGNTVQISLSSMTSSAEVYIRPYFVPDEADTFPTNTTVKIELATTSQNPVNVSGMLMFFADEKKVGADLSSTGAYKGLKSSVSGYLGDTTYHASIVLHIADDAPAAVVPQFNLYPTSFSSTLTFTVLSYSAEYDPSEIAFQQALLEQEKQTQQAIENGAQAITDGLQGVDDSVNQQGEAIQDKLDGVQQSIENAPQDELDFITDKNNSGSADQDEAQDMLDNLVPIDSAKDVFSTLYNSVSSNNVKTSLTFPAASLPSNMGGFTLWPEQDIDFTPWLSNSNVSVVISFAKVLFSAWFVYGAVVYVINTVQAGLGLASVKTSEKDGDG